MISSNKPRPTPEPFATDGRRHDDRELLGTDLDFDEALDCFGPLDESEPDTERTPTLFL